MPENKELRKARNKRYRASHPTQSHWKPFVGVDGEGGGVDEYGRQLYRLMRAGDNELYRGNARLTTTDCLEFLLSLPVNGIYVGYYFTYDATMILRDMPEDRVRYLFKPKPRGPGISPYTYWGEYAIEFRPRQYFRVARRKSRNSYKVIEGSARTVDEVGTFFQKPFVEALQDWDIGDPETVAMIAQNKERRGDFVEINQVERDYCAAECRLLAELMERFRATCKDANIVPRQWRGAGHISARLHEMNNTPLKKHRERAKRLDDYANAAYYGGRFEVTTFGRIEGDIHEYDINSAYPAAMLTLPCPIHTRWKPFKDTPKSSVYVARTKFRHTKGNVCHLPVRFKGRLFWPREAQGVYWSVEIEAARNAGADIELVNGYYAERHCDCCFFDWVRELYLTRKRIGSKTKGYPIKLGINGLYGKFAQRIGAAPYQDHILAGIITATTRAMLVNAYAADPDAVIMMATDGLYTRRPLNLDTGDQLGQWEYQKRNGLFIVQPGIYWSAESAGKPKTRGIPRSKIIEQRQQFEEIWERWIDGEIDYPEPPIVTVPLVSFVSHRLVLHQSAVMKDREAANRVFLRAGAWIPNPKQIKFDWHSKRQPARIVGQSLLTKPLAGNPDLVSEVYNGEALSDIDTQNLELEGQPDYEPWGNSGE